MQQNQLNTEAGVRGTIKAAHNTLGDLIVWAPSADESSAPDASFGSGDVYVQRCFAARTRVGVVVMVADVATAKEPYMHEQGSGIGTYLQIARNDRYKANDERKIKPGSERSQYIDDVVRGEGRSGKLSIRACT